MLYSMLIGSSTRPFLDDIEKKWLAFQLLCALRDCHARNVYHGDIKTENTLVTSWNWLYLTDFSSSFKKTYLPEDNPADFSYFFDISGRRTCYLAPERFLGVGDEDDGRGVTWAMDIFSAGCVIAELFVESPIFSLSQLFKYRKGEYDPTTYLGKIEDKDVRELVSHMIQIEPESRYSAEEYLNFWRRKAFPEYFYSFLHQYMGLITDSSSGRTFVVPETTNFGEADERIDRVYNDFDKISYFLGYDSYKDPQKLTSSLFPLQVDIPNYRHVASSQRKRPADHGTLIFLSLVVSSIRNTARATARVKACDLLLAFAEQISDEAKLDRILPYLIVLLDDPVDAVKVAALKAMTQLLALVEIVSPVNAYVFTEYIRPRLQNLVWTPGTQTASTVRTTYAACLATLAHASLKILDMVQALRAEGSISTLDPETENTGDAALVHQNLYDVARSDLIDQFEIHTKALLTDPDPSVRRAFLGSVSSLCVFFGESRANDVVLSHLNTYLNDKDWQLKCAFFQTIVGVATYVGSSGFEDFILPLMLQALVDPEEFVVERVIRSFANMAELGLFQRSRVWEMIDIVGRFMIHPNIWIRESAVHFISASTKYMSVADNYAIVLPLIRPYLTVNITELSETMILDCLKKPLPRAVLDVASTWSQKVEKGLFWKSHDNRTFSFGGSDHTVSTVSAKDLNSMSFKKIPKNDEDDQWITRLRNIGMTVEDEIKLLALREYILRTSTRRTREIEETPSNLQNILRLADLNIPLQTVFFDKDSYKDDDIQIEKQSATENHTIADALLEASATIESPKSRKDIKRSASQTHLQPDDRMLNRAFRPGDPRRDSSDVHLPLSSSPITKSIPNNEVVTPGETIKAHLKAHDDLTSEGASTPTASIRSGQDQHGSRSKPSAITLLGRRDLQRVSAETGLSTMVVNGKMDGKTNQDIANSMPAIFSEQQDAKTTARRMNHTYDGSDPNVLKLMDNLAAENYPVDEQDFGPLVTPVYRKSLRKSDPSDSDRPWRPQGIHLATFGEHEGAINRIIPSPDHVFFLTISEDSTVKIWDTLRLKQNLIHRSRQTHKHASAVKCATFVENTHTFISGATDGSVHVVKVECIAQGDNTRYGKLQTKRTYQLDHNEHAQWLEHFRAEMVSTLIIATNLSRILAIDLRTMAILYTLEVPLQYGTPTTFCLDRKRHWLLLGTDRGVLALFDLRFQLHIKAWTFAASAPVHRLAIHPFKGRGRSFVMAGGTGHPDITIWDLEKMECREIFRTAETHSLNSPTPKLPSTAATINRDLTAPYTSISLPLTALARLSSAAGAAISPGSLPAPSSLTTPTTSPPSISSFALCSDNHFSTSYGTSVSTNTSSNNKSGFMLTAGPDRKIRFWDISRPEASAVLAGLGGDEQQPRYTVQQVSLGRIAVLEKGASSMNNTTLEKGKTKTADKTKRDEGSVSRKESRVVTIAREQKALLRSHLDVVTDVVVLESGVGSGDVVEGERSALVVSADRMGIIRAFM